MPNLLQNEDILHFSPLPFAYVKIFSNLCGSIYCACMCTHASTHEVRYVCVRANMKQHRKTTSMEVEELKELLKGREKRTLEYKRAWNEVPKNMFDTVCAFLNRDGGVIVLGVEDNGQIKKGVDPESVHQMCKDISNLSNNPQKLSPTFLLQPETVDVDGKKVIVVFVPSSSQVHKSAGNIYDRSTDGDYILKTDAEISALYLRKRQSYSENHVFPYLRLEHLDENTIAKARQLIRRKFPNHPWLEMDTMEMMRQANLHCYDLESNKSGFNLAALMLFGSQSDE